MKKHLWALPALASLAFLIFSLQVVATHGAFGFLGEHFRTGWGAQIAIDLVSAAILALCFAVPRAKQLGLTAAPWVILTLLTGSIGLFAFTARIFYVQSRVAH